MATKARAQGLFDPQIIGAAALDALRKLDPRALIERIKHSDAWVDP